MEFEPFERPERFGVRLGKIHITAACAFYRPGALGLIGIMQCIGNKKAHVVLCDVHFGRAGFGVDHAVHQTLRMNGDMNVCEWNVEKMVNLVDLQHLVYERRRVDGNFGTHLPRGVGEGLLNGNVRLNGANELDDLKRLVARTAADLHGEIAGMARTTAEMQRQLAAIQQEQARVRAELQAQPDRYAATLTRVRALAFAFGLALMGATFGILEFRDTIDVSPIAAVLFATFVMAVAGWLLLYGVGFRWDK